MKNEGGLAYMMRKRLNETRSQFAQRFNISPAVYTCYEDDLFPAETFKPKFISSVRRFVQAMLQTKPLNETEKIKLWKKITGLREIDLASLLDISMQTIIRYKNSKFMLSEDMIKKIESAINP